VLPVLLLLLIGIISGAIMVITADEVSNVSREGARWASVHGTDYHRITGKPAATAADIQAYVKQQPVMLNSSRMTVTVTWQGSNRPGQYVTVATSYDFPGIGIFKAQTFRSSSTMLMSY
jgi:Flp pilus assembly protein TadG